MAYWAVYETATGRLVSQGTRLADPLPAGLTAVDLGTRPADSLMWDSAQRIMVARPAKVLVDRLQDLLDFYPDFAAVWNSLSAARKTQIRTALIAFLGRQRYRNQSAPVTMDHELSLIHI